MSEQGSSRLIIPALGGLYESLSRFSYPIIRICAGLFAMPHGAQKLFGMYGGSAQGTAKFFAKIGIEPALPLVYVTGTDSDDRGYARNVPLEYRCGTDRF